MPSAFLKSQMNYGKRLTQTIQCPKFHHLNCAAFNLQATLRQYHEANDFACWKHAAMKELTVKLVATGRWVTEVIDVPSFRLRSYLKVVLSGLIHWKNARRKSLQ